MTPLVQNKVEEARGTWWCPNCESYADGSGGFPAGDPLRIGLEDREPARKTLAEALQNQGESQETLENIELSEALVS